MGGGGAAQPLRVVATIQPIASWCATSRGRARRSRCWCPRARARTASSRSRATWRRSPARPCWSRSAAGSTRGCSARGGGFAAAAARDAAREPEAGPAPGDHAARRRGAHDAAHRLDPHAWLDPLRVRDALLPALAARLAALDPVGPRGLRGVAPDRRRRRAATALDAEIRTTLGRRGETLRRLPRRRGATSRSATRSRRWA